MLPETAKEAGGTSRGDAAADADSTEAVAEVVAAIMAAEDVDEAADAGISRMLTGGITMGIIETTTAEAVVAVNAGFRTSITITTTTTMVTTIRGIITRGTMPQDRAIIITAIMAEGMRTARDMAVHSGEVSRT